MLNYKPRWILPIMFMMSMIPLSTYAQLNGNPVANPKAVVVSGNARFTVLTNRMIRMEWEPSGKFEDRASFVFINRNLPVPQYQVSHSNGDLIIDTGKLKLSYKENSGKFTDDNLSVQFQLNGQWHTWQPSMKDTANMKGTIRTLDGVNGPAALPSGLIARDGWYVVNDSGRPLFDNSDWPWVVPRKENGQQDWYFLGYGHDYKGELGDYIKVAGKIPMPPRFAFGYWWSRYWAYTDEEFKDLIHQFHTHEVPINVLVIDMDWHRTWGLDWTHPQRDQAGQPKGWTGYTWSPTYFPNPTKFLDWTKKEHLKVTLNLHPASGIQPYEAPYKKMAEAMGIDPATKKYVPFDITNKKFANNYFKYVIDPFEKQGVDFWWLDWQQWSTTKIPGVTPTWWLNYVFFTHMEREGNKRPLIYHRWGGLGNHRYQIGFSGDVVNTWKSLNFQPYFTATASNVGYGYWSHDIGGHMPGPDSPQLYTRWMQWGAFSPVLRTHVTKNPDGERRIWAFPYKYARAMREAILRRYSMIPYIYTMSREAYDTGVSIMRPMYYSHPNNQEAYDFKDEYMFGDNILVRPVTAPMQKDSLLSNVKVWLPKGKWVEWYTGTTLDGGKVYNRKFQIDEIPVYVKQGAVIPMQSTATIGKHEAAPDPLVLTVFPGASSTTRLYEDEGNTQSYKHDKYAWTTIHHAEPDSKTLTLTIDPAEGKYDGMPSKRSYEVRIMNSWPAASVTVNGRKVDFTDNHDQPGWWYDGMKFTTVVRLPETSVHRSTKVEVHFANDIDSPLLNGMRGNTSRIQTAVHTLERLSGNNWLFYHYHGDLWAPKTLLNLYQTGRRIELDPSSAHEELVKFHKELPEMIKKVPTMTSQRIYIQKAMDQLYDTINE
ncbi:MAG TPA: TIM-barrel domain-containing protein [Balneolales bacterium]|nr:TIM-barrel domain-containing protein [Balneolales bacterium]